MSRKIVGQLVVLFLLSFVCGGCGRPAFVIRPISASQELQETEIDRDKGWFVDDKIVVVDVDGLMVNKETGGLLGGGDNPVSLFVEKLDKARKDPDVRAVVLRVNSPGGTVGAADIMYHKLREFKRKTRKPVVACMLDVAASGAYYLSCGCDGIMAQPTSITGSIGTIVQTISFEGTMKKLGIKSVAIKSGKLKDLGSPLHDLGEEERQVLQGIITEFYEQFVGVVDKGRKKLDEERVRELADGRVFTAKEALGAGLVDRVGYPAEAIAWAKEMAGVKRSRVIMYHRPVGYKANIYSSAMSRPGVTGVLINVDLPDWLTMEGTQFLYLWQPGVGEY